MRRAVRLLLLSLAVVAVLLLFVLPGRTLLAQRHTLAVTEKRMSDLSTENARLGAEARQLQSTAQIEQIARADYGLVMPGQKAYAIIPAGSNAGAPTSTTTLPPAGVSAAPAR